MQVIFSADLWPLSFQTRTTKHVRAWQEPQHLYINLTSVNGCKKFQWQSPDLKHKHGYVANCCCARTATSILWVSKAAFSFHLIHGVGREPRWASWQSKMLRQSLPPLAYMWCCEERRRGDCCRRTSSRTDWAGGRQGPWALRSITVTAVAAGRSRRHLHQVI